METLNENQIAQSDFIVAHAVFDDVDVVKHSEIAKKLFLNMQGRPYTAKELSIMISHDRSSICPFLHEWESMGFVFVTPKTPCSITRFKAKHYTFNEDAYYRFLIDNGLVQETQSNTYHAGNMEKGVQE